MSTFVAIVAQATDSSYINNGATVGVPPQIDATNFINNALFYPQGLSLPFDTQNTLNWTNRGVMESAGAVSGFDLEFIDGATGAGSWAANILNDREGSIIADAANQSFITLDATNVVNLGSVIAPYTGLIHVEGKNVNLSQGLLEIVGAQPTGDGVSFPPTNFQNDVGISDNWWSVSNVDLNVARLLQLNTNTGKSFETSPIYPVLQSGGYSFDQIALANAQAFVYTNTPAIWGSTGQVVQVVFIKSFDPEITAAVSFSDSPYAGDLYKKVWIDFSASLTNVGTGLRDSYQIQVSDTLGSDTNDFLSLNVQTGTERPAPYEVTRLPIEDGNISPNAPLSPDIFTSWYDGFYTNGMMFTNTIISNNLYAAYDYSMTYLASSLPGLPGVTVEDLPGRVEINAESLNLNRARIRAEGVVNITAGDLVSTAGAQVEAPFLKYDLNASSGNLLVQNLAKTVVKRFAVGDMDIFSCVWTNGFAMNFTNVTPGACGGAATTNMVTSNYFTLFYVMFINNNLTLSQQTDLDGVTLRGQNTTVSDDLAIDNSFFFTGTNLTYNNLLYFNGPGVDSLSATNMPNLVNLTNHGELEIVISETFGSDRSIPYNSWVNTGTNASSSCSIKTSYFENSGLFYIDASSFGGPASGAANIQADYAKLSGGELHAVNTIELTANTLKLEGALIDTAGEVFLTVSNSIIDAGKAFPSQINALVGVRAPVLTTVGDLFGTTVTLEPPTLNSAEFAWPARDLGASPAGFQNNMAVGKINLASAPNSLIEFSASGPSNNAVYVDYLELTPDELGNLNSLVLIDPNFQVYFAGSSQPVEQLDGALNNQLHWVSHFAGPYSGVNVALENGQIIYVNLALLNSATIDSNGNGVPNAVDPHPFDLPPITVTVTNLPAPMAQVRFSAAANTAYQIDYSTNLLTQPFQLLTSITNSTAMATNMVVNDSGALGSGKRFYRVSYQP